MTSGDIDGDGNTDLALATGTDLEGIPDTISIMWGDGTGDFETTSIDVEINGDARGLTVIELGDFNADHATDLAVIDRFEDVVLIFLATGERTFGPQISSPPVSQPHDFVPADFNGDNKLDVVVVNHEFIVGAVSILTVNEIKKPLDQRECLALQERIHKFSSFFKDTQSALNRISAE